MDHLEIEKSNSSCFILQPKPSTELGVCYQ